MRKKYKKRNGSMFFYKWCGKNKNENMEQNNNIIKETVAKDVVDFVDTQPKTILNFLIELNAGYKMKTNNLNSDVPIIKTRQILVRPTIEKSIRCGKTLLRTHFGMTVLPNKEDITEIKTLPYTEEATKRTIELVLKTNINIYINVHYMEHKPVLHLIKNWFSL